MNFALDEKESHISHLNVKVMKSVCRRLGIDFKFDIFSEMDLDLGPVDGPGDWALRISEAMGATEYINPPCGADIFDLGKFAASGITLKIQEFQNKKYDCRPWDFVPGLSVIDVLMWNSPGKVKEYLDKKI